MKNYILNGAGITDREMFHRSLSETMEFPDYYGCNLDALFDVLTDIGEETCLTVYGCRQLETNLGEYYARLIRVLTDACRENPVFTCEMIPEDSTALTDDYASDDEV